MTTLTGLIGYPISHSLSPLIHGYWLEQYNIDCAYKLFTTPPARLRQTMNHMRRKKLKGLNVTVPHKQTVIAYVDEIDATAKNIGAVNTILVEGEKLIGTNTDASGFLASLKEGVGELTPYLENIVVLGAGGATRAVIVALQEAGAKRITLTNRTAARAADLVEEFSQAGGARLGYVEWESREELLKTATLLINTTSLGMHGMERLELSLTNLSTDAAVIDIVYAPLETELLKNARARGCKAVDGLGMLMHQAAFAFAAWHGVMPKVDATLRNKVLATLATRIKEEAAR